MGLDERVVLGPSRCQGCGQEVAYLMTGRVHVGWLHPDGRLSCRQRHPTKLSRRQYKTLWARQHRAA